MKKKSTPLISVIIPAYNSAGTIRQAVCSALSQTYPLKEVIVIDDGSSDGTAEIVSSIKEDADCVRLIKKTNHGVSAARNDGIRAALGEWFITLDADDYIDEGMMEALYNAAASHDADTAVCGFRNVYDDGHTEEFAAREPFSGDLAGFAAKSLIPLYDRHLISTHSNKLYRTSLVREKHTYYNEGLAVNEDIDFCMRFLASCRRIAVIKEAYLNYVQHGAGESLINTFRPYGVTSSLLVMRSCVALLEASGAPESVKNAMYERMFVHICAFAGLMYSMSGWSSKKKLAELKKLGDDEDFKALLYGFRPHGIKNRSAYFLLKNRLYTAYHVLSMLIY